LSFALGFWGFAVADLAVVLLFYREGMKTGRVFLERGQCCNGFCHRGTEIQDGGFCFCLAEEQPVPNLIREGISESLII